MTPHSSPPRTPATGRRRRHRVPVGAGIVAATLALAACGSTVQTTGEDGVLALDGSSATVGSLGSPLTPVDSAGNPLPTSADGSSPGTADGQPGTAGAPTGSAPGPGATSPGGTDAPSPVAPGDPVSVGYLVLKDAGSAFAALGFDLSTGDGRTQALAAVDLVNEAGGAGGHQIDPLVFELEAAGDVKAQFVQSCSFFFEDNDVSAVVAVYNDDQLRACAQKAGVPIIDPGISVPQATLDSYANLVKPGHPTTETAARELVDSLAAQGWFKPASSSETVRIGLLTHDGAAWDQVEGAVEGRLAAAGLELTSTFRMTEDDVAAASNAGRAATLRFSSEGVNRLLAIDKNGFALSWFGLGAASQGYYPRLGLTTMSNPVLQPTVLSPQALAGAAGIGWSPGFDTPPSQQPATSPRTGACLAALDAAGEDPASSGARQGGLLACEGTYLVADAWRGGETTLTAFLAGARALGTRYQAVSAFATDFTRSRAAASGQRAIAYAPGCDCFSYTSGTRPLG